MYASNNQSDNTNTSNSFRPFINTFRRRSIQTYQTIYLEPYLQLQPTDNENVSTNENFQPSVQTSQWKIFVLTTSITNYFCCGINMRSSVVNCFQWFRSHFQSPLALLKNRLGGEEIGGLKVKLFFFLLDWILDIGTAAYHFVNQRWIEATLTYLIVLGSGTITTVGYLRYPDIRSYVSVKAKETGIIWQILLYIPTFLPFVYGRLRLNATINCALTLFDDGESTKMKLIADRDKMKVLSLKAFWLETVLESKPQALLQTLFLLENTGGFNNISDFLPVVLSIWSMYSMTNEIYDLVALNYKDDKETYSKLYGNTYTALSILAPVMIVNIRRDPFSSNFEIFLATLTALLVYYVVFEVIYQISYFISNAFFSWGKSQPKSQPVSDEVEHRDTETDTTDTDRERHTNFSRLYQVVLLVFFSGCLISWDFLSQIATNDSVKRMIILPIYSLFLITNAVTFVKAKDFVVESFRLKNVKIDNSWKSLRIKWQNCFSHTGT